MERYFQRRDLQLEGMRTYTTVRDEDLRERPSMTRSFAAHGLD
jgi:hypothetical protein